MDELSCVRTGLSPVGCALKIPLSPVARAKRAALRQSHLKCLSQREDLTPGQTPAAAACYPAQVGVAAAYDSPPGLVNLPRLSKSAH